MPFYATAYEEALAKLQSGEADDSPEFSMPSYMVAADTHNIANKNESWDEAIFSTIENTGKFIATSLISGANQLYNAPVDIGNLFGAEWERSDTGEVIASIDNDLGTYYKEHQDGVDTLGFIASSFIPGLGGIKALHAGQAALNTSLKAGKVGNNMSKALGLLVPNKQKYLTKAINDVVQGSSATALTSRNTLRAMASGFGQNTLEAAAFEIAVAGTLFQSPVLENQDLGDLVSNIAFGGLVGGAIGGALDAVKTGYAVKRTVSAADIEAKPWTAIHEAHSKSELYEKIVLDFDQLHTMPDISLQGTQFVPTKTFKYNDPAILAKKAAEKTERLNIRVRKSIGELANNDQDVAGALFDAVKQSSQEAKLGTFMGLKNVSRYGVTTPLEKEINALSKKVAKGSADLVEVERLSNLSVGHTKVWGHEAGKVSSQAPTTLSISDLIKPGQKIFVDEKIVSAGNKVWKFSTDKKWDMFKTTPLEAQARHIWAQKLPKLTAPKGKQLLIHEFDIPLLERAYKDFPENMKIVAEDGTQLTFTAQDDLFQFMVASKEKLANRLNSASAAGTISTEGEAIANRLKLLSGSDDLLSPTGGPLPKEFLTSATKKASRLSQEDIAAMVNVKTAYLSGEKSKDVVEDILALQSYGAEYAKRLGAKTPVDIWNVPQNIKLAYDATPFESLSNHVLDNMVIIKQQQKLYQEGVDNALASVLEKDFDKLLEITEKDIQQANSLGAGGRFVTAASSNYGTLAAKVEYLGNATTGLINKFKASTKEALDPLLFKVSQNRAAAIEWSTLNSRLRAIPDHYGLNEAGTALEPLAIIEWRAAAKQAQEAGKRIPKQPVLKATDAPMQIAINNEDTLALLKAHMELNGSRVDHHRTIRAAKGAQDTRHAKAFYPIPVNPKDYPFFALVTDESITGTGHTKTLYASSEQELSGMISKLRDNPHLKIRTKNEAKEYWESIGQWDYEKSLNDNYLDITLQRKGVSSSYIVPTDPAKIVNDTLNWHMDRETGLVRELVSSKYDVQFNELRRLGDIYTNEATSKFSRLSTVKYAEEVIKNPYADYIKTALGISKQSDYPWWVSANRMADEKVSQMFNKIGNIAETSKSTDELLEINKILKESGYTGAAYDETMELFANHSAPKGVLSKTVQKANALLATVVLRWDALNAANNAISANVLLGAETKAVIRAIESGSDEAIGELANLAKVKIPGSDQMMLAPQKLIANAIKRFGTSTPEMAFYKENRFVTNISDQYKWSLDELTFKGTESVGTMEGKIAKVHAALVKAGDKGEKWTGNRLAEEFNRFVAADVMKQITDIGIKHGVMTAKSQLAYINTFVNRTQGNYLAAQRPMMFQGAIGQSIGLFQTYQFNLMQQLLRHVGEGHAKDAMTLLALQGTIHGMNGLPAFNAINTHLIGNASGNTEHKDLYDNVYGIAGKEAGDWLLYGAASNMLGLLHPDLKLNLYTRGDINPRHLTIVPTDPSQVPIVQASAKFFANILDAAGKIQAGGDVATTFLQGLEHNGISRPLAGLAQTLEAMVNPLGQSYSTSKKGNIIASNDLFTLANLGRIAGGKPFDEALAIDATYRFNAYGLKDAKKRQQLGETIKSTMIAGQVPSQEQLENFAQQYAEVGGKQENFNKWIGQLYTTANTSQANKMARDLNSPFSQSMQRVMGGLELKDFE